LSELNGGTSPFKVNVSEFDCGTITGVAKWNTYAKPCAELEAEPDVPTALEPL